MERESLVYVVDDDPSVREALSGLLRSVGLSVSMFASAAEFLAFKRPDLVSCLVLDVRLPGLGGLELQERLGGPDSPLPIIFITGHGDIPMSVRAMKGGAVEFLVKPFRDEDLVEAIRTALERGRLAHRRRGEDAELRARLESLTSRERDVMALVVRGMLNKQIASELGITEITVKVHRRHVMDKMRAGSLADLVRMAARLGISGR
ncbi:MAG TPA: response regulator transcription factor [Usitatibacter sp.]|nr:response regulator transcription factor [Usitatibacter sp.]